MKTIAKPAPTTATPITSLELTPQFSTLGEAHYWYQDARRCPTSSIELRIMCTCDREINGIMRDNGLSIAAYGRVAVDTDVSGTVSKIRIAKEAQERIRGTRNEKTIANFLTTVALRIGLLKN